MWLYVGVLVLTLLAAYHNSYSAPFIFDDRHSVVENETIRHLSTAWFPPDTGAGVRGRPLINFTLALNYAMGGLDVRGYHAFNLLVHLAAALTLFGVVARTLRGPRLIDRFGGAARPLGFAAALVWAVHPLLTESVTCAVQRTESLAGLFYLLTLYGFVRAIESAAPRLWLVASVAACLVGVMAKEILVTAPLLVLLYDATFVGGGWADAWRQRRGYYTALALTWVPLATLVVAGEGRGGTVGFGHGMTWWDYALTQCFAVVHYLRLAVFPHPLVVDYGEWVAPGVATVWPQALVLAVLLVATGWAVARRRIEGFLGAWFFLILAPSSSVLPLTTQTIAEHRMYLPLIALVLLAIAGVYRWLGRRGLPLLWLGAAVLAGATMLRNADYRTEVAIWSDTVAHRPENPRAHFNLGVALTSLGRQVQAETELREAVRLAPNYTDAHTNLGRLLLATGRPAEALPELQQAVALRPDSFVAELNLATAAGALDRVPDALAHYETAVRLQPDSAVAQFGLGATLATAGRLADAIAPLMAGARLDPRDPAVRMTLANALAALGRASEAAEQFAAALRLRPDWADTHFNYGLFLAQTGDLAGAQREWQETLRLKPDYEAARESLARIRAYLRTPPAGR